MGENNEVRELKIDDLVAFRYCSHQTYEGERLKQFMDDLGESGQLHPIIVRSFWDGEYKKYEIISGHNRTGAMRELGCDTIQAEVRDNLSDHDAMALFYDIKLSKQPFSDWSCSQKIEAVRFYEEIIKEYSCQGKRTDLEEKKSSEAGDRVLAKSRQKLAGETKQIIESRQKLTRKIKRPTTRDMIARYLGISTAMLSKFRSIVKLPEDQADYMGQLLDRKMITFEAAYKISKSKLNDIDTKRLLECVEKSPDKKIDMDKLELLLSKRKSKRKGTIIYSRYDDVFEDILVPRVQSRH